MGARAGHRARDPVDVTLARVHAVTDARILAQPRFLDRAREVAAVGSRVAIHLRDRTATGRELSDQAASLRDALGGTSAMIIVNARPDVAAAISADGVQLGAGDLGVADARRVMPAGWVGRSVHTVEEARTATEEGADFLLAGMIFPSTSHPGVAAQGTAFIRAIGSGGTPVIAIGGVTPGRAAEVRAAGAWGVAAIRSIWDARDPAEAVLSMLEPWGES